MTLRRQFAFAFAIVAAASIAHAQPRKRSTPPPPAASAPMTSDASGSAVETQELPRESEVRRGFKFGAFLDGQLVIVNKEEFPDRGFTLNDAALYLEKDLGRGWGASIDLPFASPGVGTLATILAGTNGVAPDNGIAFGAGRAQGFVSYMNGGLSAKFGQFDTIFGYERNDSKDRFFADPGSIKGALVPVTHSGIMLGYNVQALTLRALVANPRDLNTMTNQNIEGGVQARFDASGFYGSLGLLIGDDRPTKQSRQLIDVQFGAQLAAISGAVYFVDRKYPGVDKHATGFGGQAAFAFTPEASAGARVEYISDLIPGIKSFIDVSAGPSVKLTSDVTARADINLLSIDVDQPISTLEDRTYFGLRGSLVATF